jgi:RimJ/RimL family protein N-acetyltransferase
VLTAVPDMPVRGVVCRGKVVELGWPEPDEFDRLTAFRNRAQVRAGFLDPRPLDPLANRQWLAGGMRRPEEGLLAIRLPGAGAVCGMIGWTGWTSQARAPELGRIVVDRVAALAHRDACGNAGDGIAVDAARALCDYFFAALGAHCVRSTYVADNRFAARVNRLAGGRVVGNDRVRRADGTEVDVLKLELTRDEWLRARVSEAA